MRATEGELTVVISSLFFYLVYVLTLLPLQVYEGVAKSGFILPEVLADHDVILTTYSTLRSDFYHLGSKQGQEQIKLLTCLSFIIFQ